MSIDAQKKQMFHLRKLITEACGEEIKVLEDLLTDMFVKFIDHIDKSLTSYHLADSVEVFVPDGVFKADILSMRRYLYVSCQRIGRFGEYLEVKELRIHPIQLISYIPVEGVDGIYEIEFTIDGDASYDHLIIHSPTLEDPATVKQYLQSILTENKYI